MDKKFIVVIGILILMWIAVSFLGLTVGPVHLPVNAIVELLFKTSSDFPDSFKTILFNLRLPRIILGSLIGAALAVAGAIFQSLLRNPLGDPYLLGVSSGAGLGATVAIWLGISYSIAFGYIPLFAFIGAMSTMAIVYYLARVDGKIPIHTLILAGVVTSTFLSTITTIIMVLSERHTEIIFWLMGHLTQKDTNIIIIIGLFIVASIIATLLFARDLNAISLGEEVAMHLGITVENLKIIMIVLASIMTAAAVSVAGLIGFVGLVVPHLIRSLTGPDHRIVLPASALGGAILLISSDILARTILAPIELPVGIMTAMIGGPFFLITLKMKKKKLI